MQELSEGSEVPAYRGGGLWVISWGCCSDPGGSPERRLGWRSASSWLFAPRPPSFSGSLLPSTAASPAWKTSHSLCRGAPLGGYCSALQESEPQEEKGVKYSSTENISDFKHDAFQIRTMSVLVTDKTSSAFRLVRTSVAVSVYF